MSDLSIRSAARRLFVMVVAALAADAAAAEPATEPSAASATRAVRTSNRPDAQSPSAAAPSHPLSSVLQYARKEQEYLRRTVRDFQCRLVKRERIDGFLQDYQYIDMWVREELRNSERIVVPLSIFMQFAAPKRVAGRRVLYVDGTNEGKMMVRNGGKHFDYVVVDVDPYGESALEESLVPITQTGFNQILTRMIEVLERHVAADPAGDNTRVERIRGAKLDQRPCGVIRITHALKRPGLEFHRANVFVDDELHVPVRVDYSDWPARPEQQPPLIAEYTYTKLRTNVGLSDSTFNPRVLRAKVSKAP
jgi:hypothetical protein